MPCTASTDTCSTSYPITVVGAADADVPGTAGHAAAWGTAAEPEPGVTGTAAEAEACVTGTPAEAEACVTGSEATIASMATATAHVTPTRRSELNISLHVFGLRPPPGSLGTSRPASGHLGLRAQVGHAFGNRALVAVAAWLVQSLPIERIG